MKLVAITSCPTGIAHSQMAAENLEQTADKLGHEIRVEIQGAMGAEDELGSDEIAEADAVIIAADTSVNRDRFEGKPLEKGTVKEAVNDAESLVNRAIEKAGGSTEATEGSSGD
jgi:PTS system fructose-specific IIB component